MSTTENTTIPAAPVKPAEAPKTAAPTSTPTPASTAPKPVVAEVKAPVPVEKTAAPVPTPAPVTPVVEPEEESISAADEMTLLKNRATLMGIEYSNNIGVDTLKAKIAAKIAGEESSTNVVNNDPQDNLVKSSEPKAPERVKSLRESLLEDAMRLIRVRITNLDPKKANLQGEIITVANEYIGTVRKFIPFGEYTDGGYHIPNCIYELLKERRFLSLKVRKGDKGQRIVEQQMAKEFAFDVLDPLTPEEIATLAAKQHATRSTADE